MFLLTIANRNNVKINLEIRKCENFNLINATLCQKKMSYRGYQNKIKCLTLKKKIMKKFISILLIFSSLYALGQKNESELIKAKNQIKTYSDVYFKFTIHQKSDLNALPNYISIDNVIGNTVYAYVHAKNFENLLSLNLPFEVVSKTSGTKALTMATTVAQMANFDRYPTYSVYIQMMQNYASTYPNICRLDTIGTTQGGRLLLVLKITDNPDVDENEPEFLYSAQMHGDELVDGVLALHMIDYLLKNYGTNATVTNLVNSIEIWINPLANPDGTYHGSNTDVSGASRYYNSGDDPNRNFPNPVEGQHPDGSSWDIETIAMMNFGAAHHFVMSVNTHSGAEVVNFPWDSWTTSEKTHADDTWWQYVSHEFADTVFANSSGGYMTGVSSDGITEGADWYYAFGSRQDYYTYYLLGREVTIELSNTKLLDASLLPAHWNYSYRSFLNYMKQSLYGVRGIITDDCTGQPIVAKVFVNSHDRDSSHVYSSLPIGDYHRPIYAGTYSITYSAPGYQSQTINNITVANKTTVIQNIQLTPTGAPIANFIADVTSGCNATIHFTNQSQAPSGSTYLWDFGDGQTSTDENPVHSYASSGNYTVSLTVHSVCTGDNTKTQTNYITITLPDAPTTTNDNICGAGVANLTANGTGTLYWYDAEQGGNQVDTGTSYHPTVSATTTYYVENHVASPSIYGGDLRSNSGGSYYTASTIHYLIFNCTAAMRLVSVEVNAQTAGYRTIQLQDASGTVLQSANVSVPAGVSRITLNFDLPVANNLRLVGPASPGLYRNTSGSNYPYNIGTAISITGNSAGNAAYYYFFYNWEVKGPDCISARIPATITVNTQPVANAGQDVNTCSSMVNLNAIPSTGSGTWHQVSGNGTVNFTNANNPTTSASLPNEGSYTLQWEENNNGCISTDEMIIIRYSSPSANAGLDMQIATGTSAQLNGTASNGSGDFSYHWEPAAMVSNANIANPTTVNLSTNQTYILSVTDNVTGCNDIDTVLITIAASVLTVNINPSSNNVCPGTLVQLNTEVTGGSGSYLYSWSSMPAGFSSNLSNPVDTPLQNTTYYVTVSDGTIQGTSSININVLPLPQASFSYSANQLVVTFSNNSTDATSYYWTFGDGTFSNMANPMQQYVSNGDYTVTLVAINGCGSDTVQQTIHVESSGIELNKLVNVQIYPNPAKDILTVNFDKEQHATISLITLDGRPWLTHEYRLKQCNVDISMLEQGLYVVMIKTEQGIFKQLFFKEK